MSCGTVCPCICRHKPLRRYPSTIQMNQDTVYQPLLQETTLEVCDSLREASWNFEVSAPLTFNFKACAMVFLFLPPVLVLGFHSCVLFKKVCVFCWQLAQGRLETRQIWGTEVPTKHWGDDLTFFLLAMSGLGSLLWFCTIIWPFPFCQLKPIYGATLVRTNWFIAFQFSSGRFCLRIKFDCSVVMLTACVFVIFQLRRFSPAALRRMTLPYGDLIDDIPPLSNWWGTSACRQAVSLCPYLLQHLTCCFADRRGPSEMSFSDGLLPPNGRWQYHCPWWDSRAGTVFTFWLLKEVR